MLVSENEEKSEEENEAVHGNFEHELWSGVVAVKWS